MPSWQHCLLLCAFLLLLPTSAAGLQLCQPAALVRQAAVGLGAVQVLLAALGRGHPDEDERPLIWEEKVDGGGGSWARRGGGGASSRVAKSRN